MASGKLVRDRIPEIIGSEGRKPIVTKLSGAALLEALQEKLAEEHAEFLAAASNEAKCEELADIVEVIIALAGQHGCDDAGLMARVADKREARCGLSECCLYEGDG